MSLPKDQNGLIYTKVIHDLLLHDNEKAHYVISL